MINVLAARQAIEKPIQQALLRRFGPQVRLMIDSGAFTDYTTKREPMNVRAYAAWCRHIKKEVVDYVAEFTGFVTLDVIGDAAQTRRNYEFLLDQDFEVLPVITVGASESDVQRFLDTSSLVCVGGLAGPGTERRRRPAIKRLEEGVLRGKRKHWLGFGQHDFLYRYKPTQFDTSNYIATSSFGLTDILHANGRIMQARNPRRLSLRERRAVRALGFNPNLLAVEQHLFNTSRTVHQCVTNESHLRYARLLARDANVAYHFAMAQSSVLNAVLYQQALGGQCLPALGVSQLRRLVDIDKTGLGVVTEGELPEGTSFHEHWR